MKIFHVNYFVIEILEEMQLSFDRDHSLINLRESSSVPDMMDIDWSYAWRQENIVPWFIFHVS